VIVFDHFDARQRSQQPAAIAESASANWPGSSVCPL